MFSYSIEREEKRTKVLVDFTLRKLEKMRDESTMESEYDVLCSVVQLYMRGAVTVEWLGGQPFVTLVDSPLSKELIDMLEKD